MKGIDINFRGLKFSISCDDSERVLHLSNYLNELADGIADNYKSGITDVRILFLVAITIADELEKVRSSVNQSTESSLDKEQVIASFDKVSQYVNNLTEIVESSLKG